MRPTPDPTPISQLSARYRGALMTFFMRRRKSRSEAEDLTQDVLLRAIRVAALDAPQGQLAIIFFQQLRQRSRSYEVLCANESMNIELILPCVQATSKSIERLQRVHLALEVQQFNRMVRVPRFLWILTRAVNADAEVLDAGISDRAKGQVRVLLDVRHLGPN
jgi:hypothetical protein